MNHVSKLASYLFYLILFCLFLRGSVTYAAPPTISSVSPNPGPVGALITITGAALTGATAVKFNGTTATYTVVSDTTITSTVPAGATTGVITVTTPSGSCSSPLGFHVLALSSFTPTTGGTGTTVTLTGTSFQSPSAVTAVKFNGTSATFSVTNDTTISATLPAGATTGPIAITDAGGTVTGTVNFTVSPPTISSVSPNLGPVGAVITITGAGLTGATAVKFNGTTATYTVVSDTTITSTVPAGATTGVITVTTPRGSCASPLGFHVLALSSFTPTNGGTGTTVTLTGTSFQSPSAVTAVKFNGTSATFSVTNDTTISATLPAGATTGTITVTDSGGTATSASNFNVTTPPTISSFSPNPGPVGALITITGAALTGATAVKFNGTTATYTVVSDTSITATVPAGATTGVITVTTPNGSCASPLGFHVLALSSFTPTNGGTGTTVTLTGTSFQSPSAVTAVKFNGTSATFSVTNDTTISATLPAGATTGTITVTDVGGTATSASNFNVSAPSGLTASSGNAPVILSWTAPLGTVISYNIYRGTTSGSETLLASPTGTAVTYTDNAVNSGGVYYYKVAAVNSGIAGPLSNEASATLITAAPTNLTVGLTTTNGQTTLHLSWTAPQGKVDYYNIYIVYPGSNVYFARTSDPTTNYQKTPSSGGFTYAVSAVNAGGESALSNGNTTSPPPPPPSTPTGLIVVGGDPIQLSWNASTTGPVDSYYIYRSTSAGTETYWDSVPGNTTTYNDTQVTNDGTTYYYKVSASNLGGESGKSNEAFTPAVSPYITLTALPTTLSLNRVSQSSGVYSVLVTGKNSFVGAVDLSVTNIPSGVTYWFSPSTVNLTLLSGQTIAPQATGTLYLCASPGTSPGTYTIKIRGSAHLSGGGISSQSASVTLVIN